MGIHAIADTIAPPPDRVDGRTRETRQWQHRRCEVMEAFVDLVRRGLADVALHTDRHTHGDLYVITERGQAELTAANAERVQA